MSVTNKQLTYEQSAAKWRLVKDCVDGEYSVKKSGTLYLPMPNATDQSKENKTRYEQYKTRAQFVNYTGRTKKGLIGGVFRKPPTVELPSQLEYLEDDASRNGISLNNLSKLTTGEILETARGGLLSDFPQTEEGLTLSETKDNKAYIINYEANQIINWHLDEGGTLDLVVLLEEIDVSTDDFSFESERRYRVLRLVDGVYSQSYYDDGGDLLWMSEPRKADGTTFNEIPFSWVGAEDNDETIDSAPLYDIAVVNIGHYRNSADYEESCFFVGQPTPVISGLTQSWVDDNGTNYMIGSRAAWLLPDGGRGELLQAAPNQMPQQAMKDKEDQMIAIGARVVQDNSGNETATTARINHTGENSALGTIADNVSAAYTKVLGWCAEFMGASDEEIVFKLNTEFFDMSLDAQTITAQIMLVDRQIIAKTDLRDNLRKGGVLDADRTDEEIDDETANDPGGLDLE